MADHIPEEAKNFKLLGHDSSAAWGGGSIVEINKGFAYVGAVGSASYNGPEGFTVHDARRIWSSARRPYGRLICASAGGYSETRHENRAGCGDRHNSAQSGSPEILHVAPSFLYRSDFTVYEDTAGLVLNTSMTDSTLNSLCAPPAPSD